MRVCVSVSVAFVTANPVDFVFFLFFFFIILLSERRKDEVQAISPPSAWVQMHIQYVTAAPVSNVLLLRLSGGEYCFVPLRRHRPLAARHKHSVNVPIEIAARQQDAEDARAHTQKKKKVDDVCAKISPLNCTHSLLILFALVFFAFLNLCLLFVQACVSPAETGCARGTESKDHEEGQEGRLGVGAWSVNHRGAVGRGGCWERSPWSSDLPGDH